MRPPALNPPADVALDGSNDQVISYLDRFKPGSPLPKNVLEDINPYQHRPSNLPVGIWYIVHSTQKKENEFGFWVVKEEASEIFTNSSISGWRTTLEFFELEDSLGQRTDWVMEEYKITQKGQCGANKEKELRAMCRVFSNKETHPKSKAGIIVDSISRKGSRSGSLMIGVDGTTFLSEADKLLDPQPRDISELHHEFDGDFLELDDLADPQSHSSSSDNSSPSSFDEYFDSIALLQELEDNSNQGQQGKDTSSRCSVTASVRPFEVVMPPASSGSLVCATGRQQPSGCKLASSVIKTKFCDDRVINHSVKRLKAEHRDESPSFAHGMAASSSTAKPIPNGEKKAAVVKMKRLKKYCCFMPF